MIFSTFHPARLLLPLLLLAAGIAHGQDYSFPFKDRVQLTETNGLSNNNVQQILQDKNGFIWLATYFGLNRYDGDEFRIFNYDPSKKYSISPGFFSGAMQQDDHGLIWLNSDNVGIYSFDPLTGNVVQYRHLPENRNSLADDNTFDLCIARDGIVWIATQNGLDAFDPKTKSFRHFVHQATNSSTISDNTILSMCLYDDNNLYLFVASGGIDCFNTKSGKRINHFDDYPSVLPKGDLQNHLQHVCPGGNGTLWMTGTTKGVAGYNLKKNKWTYFTHDRKNPVSISSDLTNAIMEDQEGNLWVSTLDSGLNCLLSGSEIFYHLHNVSGKMMEDNSHSIWVATPNHGAVIIHKKTKSIFCFSHEPAVGTSLSDNSVGAFCETRENEMLVGSSGVDIFHPESGTFQPLIPDSRIKNLLSGKTILQIYQDANATLWFATENSGLISYDKATKTARTFQHADNNNSTLGAISCTGIIQDRKKRYWVTAYTGGLQAFDPYKGLFRTFKVHEGANSISTNSVGNLMIDQQGILYLGSFDGGLITFNTDSETFRIYRHNANEPSSISNNSVSSFFQSKSVQGPGSQGIIWIGTVGGGINAFDPATRKFRSFTTHDGLCNDGIQSLTHDDKGNIWIGTINGISCFTPPADPFNPASPFHFRNYSVSDGISANAMSYFAAYKSKDGDIYFGTQGAGMFCFDPDDLSENSFLPPVRFTSFKLFNHPVEANDSTRILSRPVEHIKDIRLNYDQNGISFSFAALNYIHPEKNQYAYMLEGLDKDWIYTTESKRFANYTNLDPGTYIFKVKGSNNDGIWNPQEASIKLFISPPYWQTWWFITLLSAVFLASVYSLYRFRMTQLLRLHKVRNKISSDLHDDLGSTLSSISIYTELIRMQSKEQLPLLDKIGASSRKMIESMSDIVWAINPENDSFENLIIRMRSFAHEMLALKSMEYVFESDEKLNRIKLGMDKRKNIFLIFKEAIHNLVKYSSSCHVTINLTQTNDQLILSVRDDGKGFNVETIAKGNGLKNMQRRAREIQAELKITSEIEKGTHIELYLKTK